jgi:WD40 repeat protein
MGDTSASSSAAVAFPTRERRDVFVSYAREDTDFVRDLYARLREAEKTIYVDFSDIPQWSEDWQRDLYAQIDASDTVVVVLSPDSIGSPNVAREVDRAVAGHKRLKPILLRELGGAEVPAELSRPQWLDFRDPARIDANVHELLTVLETDVDWVELHTRFLLDANEWEERGEDRSLLLGRSDLRDADAWLARQAGKQPAPSDLQVRFILASRAAATRRQRITMGSVIAALAVTTALTIFALLQRGQAITQRDQAQSRELAALSAAQLESDPEQSLRLALRSAETARTGQAEAALQEALAESRVRLALRTPPVGSRSPILNSDVSPDGRLAVTGHRDGLARVWDLRSGRRLATLRGHRQQVSSVDISPDGRLAVTASRGGDTFSEPGDGTARVWQLPSGRLVAKLVHDADGLGSAVFSPDGRRVLTTTGVDALDPAEIWDARSGSRLVPIGKPGDTHFGTWSSDGRRIATLDGGVKVWDARNGVLLRRFAMTGDQFPVAADFSPDGRMLAVAGDGVAFIARVATGEVTRLPGRHDLFNALTNVRFCPSGACVVTTSEDDTARLWSLSGRELVTLRGHTADVSAATVSADGRYVLTESADSTARLWSARTGAQLAVLRGHDGEITGAHLLADGNRVLTTSSDGTGRVWDPGVALLQGHRDFVTDARFSPDGKEIATGSLDATAKLWSADGTLRRTLRSPDDIDTVEAISFSPDGSRLLMHQTTYSLWTRNGKWVRDLGLDVDYAVFSPDSSLVAAAGDDEVLLYDATRGSRRGALPVGSADDRDTAVFEPDFSRDGRLVAAPGALTGAHVWKVRERGRSLDLRTRERIDKVAFSPDGERLATAGDSARVARIWDIGTRKSVVLDRYPTGVREVEFSPDGRLVAAISAGERLVRVYDAETLRRLAVLRHENEVLEASFDRGSRLLLTVGDEDTAHLWDARSGRLITSVDGHSDTISAAHVSPDGRRIVTASDDGTALVHDCDECLPYDDLLDLARRRVTPLSEGD